VKKILRTSVLAISLALVLAAPALAYEDYYYLEYVDSGWQVVGTETKESPKKQFGIRQQGNSNTQDDSYSRKTYYRVKRGSNYVSDNKQAVTGRTNLPGEWFDYNKAVSVNKTYTLGLNPATAASVGQYEIEGEWRP
jgi:hypothetical protein